jgi:hypothetical protein
MYVTIEHTVNSTKEMSDFIQRFSNFQVKSVGANKEYNYGSTWWKVVIEFEAPDAYPIECGNHNPNDEDFPVYDLLVSSHNHDTD